MVYFVQFLVKKFSTVFLSLLNNFRILPEIKGPQTQEHNLTSEIQKITSNVNNAYRKQCDYSLSLPLPLKGQNYLIEMSMRVWKQAQLEVPHSEIQVELD